MSKPLLLFHWKQCWQNLSHSHQCTSKASKISNIEASDILKTDFKSELDTEHWQWGLAPLGSFLIFRIPLHSHCCLHARTCTYGYVCLSIAKMLLLLFKMLTTVSDCQRNSNSSATMSQQSLKALFLSKFTRPVKERKCCYRQIMVLRTLKNLILTFAGLL